MRRETRIIVGVLLALVGLWGGAYLYDLYKDGWQAFPTWCTAIVFFAGGALLVISGAIGHD